MVRSPGNDDDVRFAVEVDVGGHGAVDGDPAIDLVTFELDGTPPLMSNLAKEGATSRLQGQILKELRCRLSISTLRDSIDSTLVHCLDPGSNSPRHYWCLCGLIPAFGRFLEKHHD